jgi:hypothetical protein
VLRLIEEPLAPGGGDSPGHANGQRSPVSRLPGRGG